MRRVSKSPTYLLQRRPSYTWSCRIEIAVEFCSLLIRIVVIDSLETGGADLHIENVAVADVRRGHKLDIDSLLDDQLSKEDAVPQDLGCEAARMQA